MRVLMWLTIGFGAACGLCGYEMPNAWIIPVMLLCAVLALMGMLLKWEKRVSLALLCVGCILGLGWFRLYHSAYLRPAASVDGAERTLVIHATDYSEPTQYGVWVDGRTELAGNTYRIRLYLKEPTQIAPGDRLRGTFLLRVTTPDGAKEATYHKGNGVFLLAYETEKPVVSSGFGRDWTCIPALLAHELAQILDRCFPEDTAPFAKALLLGDTGGLSYEQDTNLKLSGIRHVVAVSGLHVSILFSMVSTVTLKRRWLKPLIGIPALILFAAMAGFTPSVTRACLMCGLMLLAMLVQRDYDGATALAFSCLVMLLGNPLVITSAAFQLSVGSVAGIYLFQESIQLWVLSWLGRLRGKDVLTRLKRWFAGTVSVTLSAMTFTIPLSALYFGAVSLVGILTNLLTLWVISFLFYGVIAVCLVSLVWDAGALFLASVCAFPIRYVLFVAELLGGFPLSAVYTRNVYIVLWLAFCYGLLVVFLLQADHSPVRSSCWAALGLCLALWLSWLEPLTDDFRMTVLDVGQGQSILFQCIGKNYLVDCGGDSDTETADIVAETLLSQGVSRLDGIVITHTGADHAGALENLLTRVDTDFLMLPFSQEGDPFSGERLMPLEEVRIELDGAVLTVFGPISGKGGNENSLCVLLERENCAILITGDRSGFSERMLLRRNALPQVDVLIAGHHGADDSTCRELLEAVRPRTVIISVGADDPFGAPGTALLERLEDFECQVLRTDRSGTILYRR